MGDGREAVGAPGRLSQSLGPIPHTPSTIFSMLVDCCVMNTVVDGIVECSVIVSKSPFVLGDAMMPWRAWCDLRWQREIDVLLFVGR